VMKSRRAEVWLATKLPDRNGDDAMRTLEGSLKRLQTDHLDLIHIHSLTDADDLAKVEAPGGVLKRLYQLRDQKVTKAIGITSHTDPLVLKSALEHNDFDCTQMALNAARAGMAKPDGGFGMTPLTNSFETLALPVANRKKMGVIAMKIFAQEGLSDKAPAEKLIRYSLSLPVTAVVIGMPKLNFIDENIAIAKRFEPMPPAEMRSLSDQLAADHKARLDLFFNDHIDC
jgi:predicted aldo/keto reductase-like oxidoreductase